MDTKPFNRGWLLNIGIKLSPGGCVITHDVDMIANNTHLYHKCDVPIQLCSELPCYNNGIPYDTYAGGVVSMTKNDWVTINGYTNTGVGWGGEDDDLYQRLRTTRMSLHRPKKGEGRCSCMNDQYHTKRVIVKAATKRMYRKIEKTQAKPI